MSIRFLPLSPHIFFMYSLINFCYIADLNYFPYLFTFEKRNGHLELKLDISRLSRPFGKYRYEK